MATAYLSRTFASPTNASKFTYSAWVKRSAVGGTKILLYANGGNAQNFSNIMFNSSDSFFWHILHSNSEISKLRTNAVLKDTSAWYHLVFQYDSTQATAANRTKMYINGVEVTSYHTQTNSGQNSNYHMNTAVEHFIGAEKGNTGGSVGNYFDGEMAHVHFVDGTIYAPSTFGETDATTGIWKPKTDPGISQANYGNNGFWLKFDNSANMGLDSSGNSNNWTTSGTIIQNKDTPSNSFATLNPSLDVNNGMILSNAGSTAKGWDSGNHRFAGANPCVSSGKYYYEVKVTKAGSSPYCGIIDAQSTLRRNNVYFVGSASGDNDSGYAVNMSGDIYHDNSSTYATSIGSISTGDILGFAVDLDSAQRTCTIYKNGTSMRTFNIDAPSSGFYMLGCCSAYNEINAKAEFNFGNGYFGTTAVSSAQNPTDGVGIFEYTPPTNYRALCTKSINAQEYS